MLNGRIPSWLISAIQLTRRVRPDQQEYGVLLSALKKSMERLKNRSGVTFSDIAAQVFYADEGMMYAVEEYRAYMRFLERFESMVDQYQESVQVFPHQRQSHQRAAFRQVSAQTVIDTSYFALLKQELQFAKTRTQNKIKFFELVEDIHCHGDAPVFKRQMSACCDAIKLLTPVIKERGLDQDLRYSEGMRCRAAAKQPRDIFPLLQHALFQRLKESVKKYDNALDDYETRLFNEQHGDDILIVPREIWQPGMNDVMLILYYLMRVQESVIVGNAQKLTDDIATLVSEMIYRRDIDTALNAETKGIVCAA